MQAMSDCQIHREKWKRRLNVVFILYRKSSLSRRNESGFTIMLIFINNTIQIFSLFSTPCLLYQVKKVCLVSCVSNCHHLHLCLSPCFRKWLLITFAQQQLLILTLVKPLSRAHGVSKSRHQIILEHQNTHHLIAIKF